MKRTFLMHMSYLMRHVWDEDMRTARVKQELSDEDVTRDLKTVSKEPPADEGPHRRRSLQVLRELGDQVAPKKCRPGARPVVFQRKGATDHE